MIHILDWPILENGLTGAKMGLNSINGLRLMIRAQILEKYVVMIGKQLYKV